MTRAADDYLHEMQALLPPGPALPREPGTNYTELLASGADEFARVDARAEDLLRESDPGASLELLEDWERVFGLPDPCRGTDQTIQERRQAVVAKMLYQGGLSRQYFIQLAATLGYEVEIEEYQPFVCGISQCGVDALNDRPFSWIWRVRVIGSRVTHFRMGESELGVDRLLKISRASDLECLFNRLKPAHTKLFVAYEGA